MNSALISRSDPVTILGPTQVKTEDIDESLRLAPTLVAADGGADQALKFGKTPDAVIGDFDSFCDSRAKNLSQTVFHRIDEQTSTDFEKCLTHVDAPLCLALGFVGRRLDHELSVMSTLVRFPERLCILIGSHDIVFAPRGVLNLDLPAGTRVSLMPFAKTRMRAEGLVWPIDYIAYDPLGRIGTSNEAQGPVQLIAEKPGMLVILPRAMLGPAIAGLLEATSHAPAQ